MATVASPLGTKTAIGNNKGGFKMNEINTAHLVIMVISGIAGGIIWNVLTALLNGYFREKWGG